jgi:hypothetical protein
VSAQRLEALGARVESCCIPELEAVRVAHTATIITEMLAAMWAYYSHVPTRRLLNADVRCSLTSAAQFTAAEYIQAQARALAQPCCCYPRHQQRLLLMAVLVLDRCFGTSRELAAGRCCLPHGGMQVAWCQCCLWPAGGECGE